MLLITVKVSGEMVFTFTSPADLREWRFGGLDASLPPPRVENGRLVLHCSPETYLGRPLSLDASQYNRIEMRLRGTTTMGHNFTLAMVSWAREGETDIRPERQVEVEIPGNTMCRAVFQMDQSLVWSSQITNLRFDFLQKIQKQPGLVEIESVRLYRDTGEGARLKWNFADPAAQNDWEFGEIIFEGWEFRPLPVRREGNAVVFTSSDGFPAIQRRLRLDAEEVSAVATRLSYQGERKFQYERGTWSKFFWGWEDSHAPHRLLRQPIQQVTGAQTIRHEVITNHYWRGTLDHVQFVLVSQPGTVRLEEVEFIRLDDLGREGQGDAAVRWLNLQQVNEAIRASNAFKPLLVYVDHPDVPICRQVEQQLAADPFFIRRVGDFHSVRLNHDDPVVTGWLQNIFRVPTMIVFSWDPSSRRWVERDRLAGPQVGDQGSLMLQRWATGGG